MCLVMFDSTIFVAKWWLEIPFVVFNIRPVTVWVLLSAAYNKFTRPSDMKKMGTWTHEEDIGLRLSVGDMVFDGLVNGNHIWKWFDFVMLEGSKWVSKIIICILHWVSSHAWPMVDEIYWEIDRLDSSIVWRGDPLNWCQCTQHNICTQQCYNWIVVVRGFHLFVPYAIGGSRGAG